MEGKGTQGTATLTAEGEPLGEGCPHSCPLQLPPLTFLALDHSLPTWSPGKEAIHFVVSTGTLLRVNGDTSNSYLGQQAPSGYSRPSRYVTPAVSLNLWGLGKPSLSSFLGIPWHDTQLPLRRRHQDCPERRHHAYLSPVEALHASV